MTSVLLNALIGLAVALLALWLLLVIVLLIKRPDRATIAAASRFPAELVRFSRTLIRDKDLPRGARLRLWILLGYLVLPIDLIPDFIPVIGYADDVVVTAILLRGTVRSIGRESVVGAWQGSDENLAALMRLCGLSPLPDESTGSRSKQHSVRQAERP